MAGRHHDAEADRDRWTRVSAAHTDRHAPHELHSPPDAATHASYEPATDDRAAGWPVEDLWVAHRSGPGQAPDDHDEGNRT
ncbi:hypothetical protein ACIBEJ_24470 [Nonomuraea sp. NPDC050790]|uniref:hypothetical protein n=1 Tax=Nonomuraea sp. NPDC050790 TaxID=3364371 RepID=UPI0037966CA0